MTRLLWPLIVLAAGYLAICLYFFLKQREMLYFPERVPESRLLADARNTPFERWVVPGTGPIGWVTRDGSESPAILLFHGNSGQASDRASIVERLRAAGIDARIYVMEYPGFGAREGTPSQPALTEAGVAALDAIPGSVVLFGESLGTGVASQVAARRPDRVQGLILLTPFDSIAHAAAFHYPWLPVHWIVLDRFDSVEALKDFRRPTVIVAATDDLTTPVTGARRLFESLRGPKEMRELPTAGHNGALWGLPDADWKALWSFVTVDSPGAVRPSSGHGS
ncbi:MAG: alpha/beta hydrolase [Terrimicrobiaceae bacterium]|nr:alpha/beta hydrolase [Terrimicrobiaceae bacterium]